METYFPPTLRPGPGQMRRQAVYSRTRIRVWDIYVEHERLGQSVDEILIGYSDVTHADVPAALAYYYDHQAEIDAQMKADDEYIERMKKAAGPSLLQQKSPDLDLDAGSDRVPT